MWLQPGSFDQEGLAFAKREFDAGIGGGNGGEGACVLVSGEEGMRVAGRVGAGEGEVMGGKL